MTQENFNSFNRYKLVEDEAIDIQVDLSEKKSAMVLCRKTDITGPNNDLLNKILKAIGQDEQNTQIIGIDEGNVVNVTALLNQGKPQILLSFEINLNKNGLNIEQKLYKPTQLLETTLIISESLSTLQKNIESKRKLWAVLKSQFGRKD